LRAAGAGTLIWLAPVAAAHAVPAFAVQTSQPCAACHVGAFGPQLKPFGRDFKLHGNVRLALQYVDYFTFNSTSANARDNNNLYLSASTALKL
jgi:hypothetical protein